MEFKNVKKYLSDVGKKTVEDAKANLAPHSVTGNLARKTTYKVVETKDGVRLRIVVPKYGEVLDKGISGSLLKRSGTPFVIKPASNRSAERISGNVVTTHWTSIRDWVQRKGIQFHGKNQNTTSYLINRALKRRGFPATKWLTKAKNKNHLGSRTHRKGLALAFKQDIKAHRLKRKNK